MRYYAYDYAYDRLGREEASSAHRILVIYFQAVSRIERPQRLDDLQPLIELYHHTLAAGQYDEAFVLFRDRLHSALYYQFGAYQLYAELLRGLVPDGEEQPPRLKDGSDRTWTLATLANSSSLSGQLRRAVPMYEQAVVLYEKLDNKQNLAIGLGAVASAAYTPIGALQAAAANLRRRIALCQEIEGAIGRQELGRLLAYSGAWQAAEEELATALTLFEKNKNVQTQGIVWAYRSLLSLLLARSNLRQKNSLNPSLEQPPPSFGEGWGGVALAGVTSARRALELAEGGDPNIGGAVLPRDLVRAHWLLGAALCVQNDLPAAEHHLLEALTRCRNNNTVEAEANILIDLARLRVAQGEPNEAKQLANEALTIAERCGYVLQQADAHLELAKLAQARGERRLALDHARQARLHATCDGPPDWTYKVAYEEAGELVERLTG